MKPTIAFVAGHLSQGGAEQQLYFLLRGLSDYPIRPTVATLTPSHPGGAAVRSLGIPVEPIPHSRWKVDRILRLAAWLRRERPLLVHSWTFYGNLYAAWAGALAGVPLRLGSVRGEVSGPDLAKGSALLVRLGLTMPHAVVFNSSAAIRGLSQRSPSGARMRLVRNGMDVLALRTAAGDCLDADALCHPDRNGAGPVLALVGRLISLKNVPMFFRVIANLTECHPGIQGWLIGDGRERPALQELAQGMGIAERIRFWGQRTDVARLLAGADILCHCSHSEGLSNAIMEASALGLPLVATRAGGAAEIVENGTTGFLVEVDDSVAMTSCVERLIGDPALRARMGSAGRRKMETEFSNERMVRDMLQVYRELLEERSLGGALGLEY